MSDLISLNQQDRHILLTKIILQIFVQAAPKNITSPFWSFLVRLYLSSKLFNPTKTRLQTRAFVKNEQINLNAILYVS